MHASPRLAALVALCAAVVAGGVFLTGGPAGAAVPSLTVSPDTIPPVNVLPSESDAVLPSGSSAYARAYLVGGFSMTTQQADAAVATEAGTATSSDAATLAAMEAQFASPATKALTLTKTVAGDAAVDFGTFELGTMIGSTASRILGFKDNDVCVQQNAALTAVAGWLDGVNCDAYNQMLSTDQQNLDAPSGVTSAPGCFYDGSCVTYLGEKPNYLAFGDAACFSYTGSLDSGGHYIGIYLGGSYYGESTISSYWSGPCGGGSAFGIPLFGDTRAVTSWFPDPSAVHDAGTSVPVVTSSGDPTRHWECKITGNSGTVYTSDSATFTESDASYAPVECPPVPAPDWATHQTITEVGGPLPLEVQDQDTTPEYQSTQELYPDCSTGACPLLLTPTTSGALACQFDPAPCADWFSDPNKTSDYTCTYGPHTVDLSECDLYSPSFKPGASASGTALADPLTGDPLSGQTTPTPDQTLLQSPAADPTTKGQCFPNGWGVFNPVNWIFQPIQCAFEWAFVPRNSTMKSDGLKIRDAVNASAIGSVGGIITGMGTFSIDGGGCSGIPWNFSIAGLSKTVNLLAACSGDPLAATAGVVKSVLTAVVITAGVLASARYIAQIFGYVGFGGIIDAERRQEYRDTARERGGARFK